MLHGGHWRIVGTYQRRSLRHDDSNHQEGVPHKLASQNEVPIVLYDTRQKNGGTLAPHHIAVKVPVPVASDRQVKILSGSAQMPVLTQTPLDPTLSCGTALSDSCPSHAKIPPLVVATTIPRPSNIIFVPSFVILLANIAITAAGMTTTSTNTTLKALTCLLVLAPDILAICLILKRGRISAFLAVHVELWPCIAFLFLLPLISMIFLVHVFLTLIFLLFLFRLRASSHMTYFVS